MEHGVREKVYQLLPLRSADTGAQGDEKLPLESLLPFSITPMVLHVSKIFAGICGAAINSQEPHQALYTYYLFKSMQ